MSVVRVSAKNLGALRMPNFCERCYWLKLQIGFNPPFQTFPSIFSKLDVYTKKVVHAWFDEQGQPPPWLAGIGDIVGYAEAPGHGKFRYMSPGSRILLTGVPDELLVREDGALVIVDYKTADFKGTDDPLFPIYDIQINAYAFLAYHLGMNPVKKLVLTYMEPVTGDEAAADETIRMDNGFAMRFQAKLLEVPLDITTIPDLLLLVRHIADKPKEPEGRQGCMDCVKLDELIFHAGGLKAMAAMAEAVVD